MQSLKTYLAAAAVGWTLALNPAWAVPDLTVKYYPLDQPCCANLNLSLSADGRYAAYRVPRSGSTTIDIFVMDLQTGAQVQANRMITGGLPTNAQCDTPAISADGRYVVFGCASAPMGGDLPPGGQAYYVYDRLNDKTEVVPLVNSNRVSRTYPAAISKDSRYIAYRTFDSAANFTLYVRDRINKTTQVAASAKAVNPGGSPAYLTISDDGRYVSYNARPVNGNSLTDIYVYDMTAGVTEMINVSTAGVPGTTGGGTPIMSGDASVVSFSSADAKLTGVTVKNGTAVFIRDRRAGTTELISGVATYGLVNNNSMSANGRYIAFTGNPVSTTKNLYLYDRLTKVMRVIPGAVSNLRTATFSAFSADGRYLVFESQTLTNPAKSIGFVDLGVPAGVALSTNSLTLTEGGAAGTYTLVLTQAPDADVKVKVAPDKQLSVARTELVFTPANWNVPQVVSVQAIQDGVVEGAHSGVITHTVTSTDVNYTVVTASTVTVAITDAIVPTLVLPGATWNQTDLPLNGTAAPNATVLLTATNRNTNWSTAISTVADAQGRWSYTLTGLTDGVIEFDVQADGLHGLPKTITVALPAKTVDVTASVKRTAYGLVFNRSTGLYVGDFTLTNIGSAALSGPLQLEFGSLTAGVTLTNASGTHNGAPYIAVAEGLAAGASVTVSLQFSNPAKGAVEYVEKIYSGSF